jgi:hypothetical protein
VQAATVCISDEAIQRAARRAGGRQGSAGPFPTRFYIPCATQGKNDLHVVLMPTDTIFYFVGVLVPIFLITFKCRYLMRLIKALSIPAFAPAGCK